MSNQKAKNKPSSKESSAAFSLVLMAALPWHSDHYGLEVAAAFLLSLGPQTFKQEGAEQILFTNYCVYVHSILSGKYLKD